MRVICHLRAQTSKNITKEQFILLGKRQHNDAAHVSYFTIAIYRFTTAITFLFDKLMQKWSSTDTKNIKLPVKFSNSFTIFAVEHSFLKQLFIDEKLF